MHTDFLIIGQGIAGTLLSYELICSGQTVMVLDTPTENKASLIAAAVINPLIGKNWTIAKEAEAQIPIAIRTYRELNHLLIAGLLSQKPLLVFHQSEKEEDNFRKQIALENSCLSLPETADLLHLKSYFDLYSEVGIVQPVYTIDAATLLEKWKTFLQSRHSFMEEFFEPEKLVILRDKLKYKDITAGKIIFCEGAAGSNNPFFLQQRFTQNRGDVLLLSIPGLPDQNLYQKGIRLVPRNDGLFWCGSNYTWEYNSLLPDKEWKAATEKQLKEWLRLPFEITAHLVAERPTTAGQIPVLAQSAEYKNMYFFNGLGTRGFSAGPYLAKEMYHRLMMNDE